MNKSGKCKILMIGPLPPPYGGVSIHISRLSRLIESEFVIDFIDEAHLVKQEYFNLRSFNLIQYFKRVKKSELIYIHSGPTILMFFHITIGKIFSKKIVLAIHSYPIRKRFLFRLIDELYYRFVNRIIIVNSVFLDRVSLPSKRYIIKDAFIPPEMNKEPPLPTYISDWMLKKKRKGEIIICANASCLDTFNDQDLYGLDLCIEVANKLIKKGYPLCFVFNVSTLEKHKETYDRYRESIKELNIQDNYLLINEELSFVRLVEQSDIVLRPTNTDGDALTVREAIYLGKTVIASDVVQRPEGTILFNSRDIDDLERRLIETLNCDNPCITIQKNDGGNIYRRFYLSMINTTLNKN